MYIKTNLKIVCSCGDALCTIACSTTFPEPFITPTDRRRLGWVHKSLAGTRCSDHVALLNAFQAWESARYRVINYMFSRHSLCHFHLQHQHF